MRRRGVPGEHCFPKDFFKLWILGPSTKLMRDRVRTEKDAILPSLPWQLLRIYFLNLLRDAEGYFGKSAINRIFRVEFRCLFLEQSDVGGLRSDARFSVISRRCSSSSTSYFFASVDPR